MQLGKAPGPRQAQAAPFGLARQVVADLAEFLEHGGVILRQAAAQPRLADQRHGQQGVKAGAQQALSRSRRQFGSSAMSAVWDGDHRVVGEGLQQLDVPLRESLGALPGDRDDTHRLPGAQHLGAHLPAPSCIDHRARLGQVARFAPRRRERFEQRLEQRATRSRSPRASHSAASPLAARKAKPRACWVRATSIAAR